jgi:hypothetical protein
MSAIPLTPPAPHGCGTGLAIGAEWRGTRMCGIARVRHPQGLTRTRSKRFWEREALRAATLAAFLCRAGD